MSHLLQQVAEKLNQNNMPAICVQHKEEVPAQVAGLIKAGSSVAVGGSATLFACGVIDHLRSGRYDFWDRHAPGLNQQQIHQIHHRAFTAGTYLCSTNAITMAGELYNVDGNSNRIAALAYGPQSVIVVAGVNKIVQGLTEAVFRVRTHCAPKICRLRGLNTPCRHTGACIAANAPIGAAGCTSPQRVCCNTLVCGPQRVPGRIKIILVNEELGI